jgi:hypothetical protein
MPLPQHIVDELGRKRAQEHEAASRDTRREIRRSAALVVLWSALGIAFVLTSFAVSDLTLGRILFWTGVGAGNGGMLFTLLAAYRRGEKRGDW